MKNSDLLQTQASSLSIEQIKDYLHEKKWFEDGKIRNFATIWHLNKNDEAEIVLPSIEAKDYQQRTRDALVALAACERRDVLDLIAEIKSRYSNVIAVRVIHPDTEDGTIPIDDGILLITKAKDLLSAAAQSLYSKRKHFSGPAPKQARKYLDTLLLGQTQVGSYVVNVIGPNQSTMLYEQEVTNSTSFSNSVPLGQAIASSLVAGLDALTKASSDFEEIGKLSVFDNAVVSGASANLCDALLGFSGVNRKRTFEISVTTSTGPLFGFESETRKFEFDGKRVEVIEKACSYFKDNYVLPDRILTGYITKLVRPREETAGTITLDSVIGDVERKVQVALTGDDYHLAVIAHDNGQMVRVQGDVHIKSKAAQLLNPKNFGSINTEDLF